MRKRAAIDKHPSQLTIREQLGISQEHYAQYCQISLSMLAMIETKKRYWPLDKNDYEIRLAFKESEQDEAPPVTSELTPTLQKELEGRFLDLQVEIQKKKKEDEKTQFANQQAEKRRKTCARLRPKQTDPESTRAKLVDYWDLSAQVKLEQKHPAIAEIEEIHIEAVRKKMAVLEKWLKKE
jgi:transcriptional regulator with XRE-family HTH domain